jgi:hypothetical protein
MSFERQRISDLTTTPAGSRTLSIGPGCTTSVSSTTGGRVGVYRSMTDIVSGAYKASINRGVVINNPMSRERFTFSVASSGYQHTYSGANCVSFSGTWRDTFTNLLNWKLGALGLTQPASLLASDGDLTSRACAQALTNVKNPSVQGLVFVKELNQTLNLLKNPLSAVTTLLRKERKKIPISKSEKFNAASSQYLAVVFGLRPLMMDVEGVMEALHRQTRERETARGTASDNTSVTTSNILLHAGTVLTDSRYKTVQTETLEVRAGALYSFEGRTLADSMGFSLRDLPSAAWEILPWSFVVDWFSNVGQLISAVTANCSNEFLAEWVSHKRTHTITRTVTSTTVGLAPWVKTVDSTDQDSAVYETYWRTPTKLGAHLELMLNLSLNRTPVMTALSLITQQLTKRK